MLGFSQYRLSRSEPMSTLSSKELRTLAAVAKEKGDGRLAQFTVAFPKGQPVQIEATVVTQDPQSNLQATAEEQLQRQLHHPVALQLTQLPSWHAPLPASSVLAAPVAPNADMAAQSQQRSQMIEQLRRDFPLPLQVLDVDPEQKRITILPSPAVPANLFTLHAMDLQLQANHPGWQIHLIPPPQSLPLILFPIGLSTIAPAQQERLTASIWALENWGSKEVVVIGRASTVGNRAFNLALAKARAEAVAQELRQHGIEAKTLAEFTAPEQMRRETELGLMSFQSAEIVLPATTSVRSEMEQIVSRAQS